MLFHLLLYNFSMEHFAPKSRNNRWQQWESHICISIFPENPRSIRIMRCLIICSHNLVATFKPDPKFKILRNMKWYEYRYTRKSQDYLCHVSFRKLENLRKIIKLRLNWEILSSCSNFCLPNMRCWAFICHFQLVCFIRAILSVDYWIIIERERVLCMNNLIVLT